MQISCGECCGELKMWKINKGLGYDQNPLFIVAGTTRLELATSGVTESITRFSDHLFFLYLFEIAYLYFARCVVLCNPVYWISEKRTHKGTHKNDSCSKIWI